MLLMSVISLYESRGLLTSNTRIGDRELMDLFVPVDVLWPLPISNSGNLYQHDVCSSYTAATALESGINHRAWKNHSRTEGVFTHGANNSRSLCHRKFLGRQGKRWKGGRKVPGLHPFREWTEHSKVPVLLVGLFDATVMPTFFYSVEMGFDTAARSKRSGPRVECNSYVYCTAVCQIFLPTSVLMA